MRILLALPPDIHNLEIYRVTGIRAPPLGLASIASVLEARGHKVAIVDSPTLEIDTKKFLHIIKGFKPDIVGLSIQTPLAPKAYRIARMIKESYPDVVILAGGIHATYMYEEALRNGIDIVVRFEGEETIAELIDVIDRFGVDPSRLRSVKGIAFRERDNRVLATPTRNYIENLDILPMPAYHLLPMDRYTVLGKNVRVVHIMASRGCPYGCVFCSTSYFWGRKLRMKSPSRIAREIEFLVDQYHAKYVVFTDDELTASRKFVYDLVKELKERKLDIVFSCGARVDHLDREFIKFLLDNGCIGLYLGVESGSQEILDKIGKRLSIEQIRKVFNWLRELKAFTVASFIIGLPWETIEDVEKTIRFAIELDPSYAQFTIATPYPGTPLYSYAEEHNLIVDRNWEHYTTLRPVMKGFYLDTKTIAKLLKKAYRSFYLRWNFIKRELFAKRILELIPLLLKEAFSMLVEAIKSRV